MTDPAVGAFGAGSQRGLVPARGRRRVGRRTIVAADPAVRGRWPGWRPGGAVAVGDRPARGG